MIPNLIKKPHTHTHTDGRTVYYIYTKKIIFKTLHDSHNLSKYLIISLFLRPFYTKERDLYKKISYT